MDAALSYDFSPMSRKKISFPTIAAKAKADEKERFVVEATCNSN